MSMPASNATTRAIHVTREGSELIHEMRRRWRDGENPPAEEFLERDVELARSPEAAIDVIYEEYCLRLGRGDEAPEPDILRRFPQWAGPLRVMFDCHRSLLETRREPPRFPLPGERIGDFRLLRELARGGRGRVFLAAQTALEDRRVVLKMTPLDGAEHRALARLQHTNIVPLYSVFDDAAKNLRVLCMPWFGRATLASLLESLAAKPLVDRSGGDVVDAIDRMRDSDESPVPDTAARQMLASVPYVQAIVWTAACVADALQFAHERGLVHLDLKPSNVLLAADGQPMLLDFHLARAPVRPGREYPENFGGTLVYMPPEQRRAMDSLWRGGAVEAIVDHRADLYALGAILYESLGGQLPPADHPPPTIQLNPLVSVGVSDIIARCLAKRPEDRYESAVALADDLRRHLTDQPLCGVRNRSLLERWNKWRRRRPAVLYAVGMLIVVSVILGMLLFSVWSRAQERREQAGLALLDAQRQMQTSAGRAEAVQTLERALGLLDRAAPDDVLRRRLRDELAHARGLLLADEIHRLADEIRVLYVIDAIPPDRIHALASSCKSLWGKREVLLKLAGPDADSPIRADVLDLAIFAASFHRKNLPAAPQELQEGLQILNEAQEALGPSSVLDYERHWIQTGRADRSSPSDFTAGSAWEHLILGRAMLASGELSRALQELDQARALEPGSRWGNFYYGICAYRMQQYEPALAAFGVCIGAVPQVAAHFHNRALTYAALGKPAEALHDYNSALRLDPGHADSALNRAALLLDMGMHQQALADLELAEKLGADPVAVHYNRAAAFAARGDSTLALSHVSRALAQRPDHPASIQLRKELLVRMQR